MSPEQIEKMLREALAKLAGILPDRDFQNALQNVDAGEPEVAFDVICQQLFEHDIPVPKHAYMQLIQVGRVLELPEQNWAILQPLIVE
jgi:hypothetical protein